MISCSRWCRPVLPYVVAMRPMCRVTKFGPARRSHSDVEATTMTRMSEAKMQATLTADIASLQLEQGRWFVVKQPAESTMRRHRAMRIAAADARGIAIT